MKYSRIKKRTCLTRPSSVVFLLGAAAVLTLTVATLGLIHVDLLVPFGALISPEGSQLISLSSSSTTAAAAAAAGEKDVPANSHVGLLLRDSILRLSENGKIHKSTEKVWEELLKEQEDNANNRVVMEVGMHSAHQSLQAAKLGYEVHGIEPSPKNFERVQGGVTRQPEHVQEKLHLHNKAAGKDSSTRLTFSSSGGTGDHVGVFDMWNMKPGKTTDPEIIKKIKEETVSVQSVALDDIILHELNNDGIYVLKIDTQGFEHAVFSGLTQSLKSQKVQFVLTEFWPHGIDLINNASADNRACIAAEILHQLADSGYILYALWPAFHPAAPDNAKKYLRERYNSDAPLHDLKSFCMYFYDLADKFPDDKYKMGYWTDVLAVAPNAQLGDEPKTELGKAIMQDLENASRHL